MKFSPEKLEEIENQVRLELVRNPHISCRGLSKNLGYNVLKSKFVDLNNEGILDPTIFLKKSLINAVKVVSMLINTACMIA